MKVLIQGAGPAGLTLAYALDKRGVDVTVVDQISGVSNEGYAVSITANGWSAIQAMGILEALKTKAIPLTQSETYDPNGRLHLSYSYTDIAKAIDDKMIVILRDDLHKIMLSATKHIDIQFNTSIASLDNKSDGVDVKFTSGTKETYDLVVGADGYRSSIRKMCFGSDRNFIHKLGYRVAAWKYPLPSPLSASMLGVCDVDHQATLYDCGNGMAATLFCWRDQSTSRIEEHHKYTILNKAFDNWPDPIATALKQSKESKNIFVDTVSQIDMPKWSKGRVVLLGDAAWCLTFLSGQGTSTALAGAMILAEELINKPYVQAMEAYEARLRPAIAKIQTSSRVIGGQYVPKSKHSIQLQKIILPILFSKPFLPLLARKLMLLKIKY